MTTPLEEARAWFGTYRPPGGRLRVNYTLAELAARGDLDVSCREPGCGRHHRYDAEDLARLWGTTTRLADVHRRWRCGGCQAAWPDLSIAQRRAYG